MLFAKTLSEVVQEQQGQKKLIFKLMLLKAENFQQLQFVIWLKFKII